ncbi:hypothetical protein [Eubacterium callanderi]|uniref:hypothetical protein n=1 Tax=Eubacterium callanderi TaxID=53442 RepID=UPI001652A629|nr:hypothetical protein [Eubacterium callanderi]
MYSELDFLLETDFFQSGSPLVSEHFRRSRLYQFFTKVISSINPEAKAWAQAAS